jgi:hypothetical protein
MFPSGDFKILLEFGQFVRITKIFHVNFAIRVNLLSKHEDPRSKIIAQLIQLSAKVRHSVFSKQ